MSSLFEMEKRIVEIMDNLSDLIPEDDETLTEVADVERRRRQEELEAELSSLLGAEANKVDAVLDVLRRFDTNAKELGAEMKRLGERAKRFEKKGVRLAGYILDVMEFGGAKRLDGVKSSVVRIRNAPTVACDDASGLPIEYQRHVYTFVPQTAEEVAELEAIKQRVQTIASVSARKDTIKDAIGGQKIATKIEPDGSITSPLLPGAKLLPGKWRLKLS